MSKELVSSEFLSDKALPLKLIRRDPQENYGIHCHEFSELVIVDRGCGDHIIYGERHPVSAGDVFLIKRGTQHGYENPNNLALYNLLFDLHDFSNPLAALCRYPVLRTLFTLEPGVSGTRGLHLLPSEMPSILRILQSIEEEQAQRKPDHASAMAAWFVLLTVELARLYGAHPQAASDVASFEFYRLVNEISDHPNEPWNRENMAKRAGMSVSTLTRQFKKVTGYPPNEYLLMLRLKKSRMLLLNPELSISEVSDRSGFSDSNYFCRQFKKHFGIPPRKSRKG